jgi:mono/diheme cytochrome c family protein
MSVRVTNLWNGALLGILLFASTLSHSADGMMVFKENCAACHQADASGTPGVAPPLIGAHWQKLQDPQNNYILQVLSAGLTGKLTVGEQTYNGAMPMFRHLDPEQIAAVATYVLSLNAGNVESPVLSAADVMAVRDQNGKQSEVRALRRSLLKE